MFFSNLFPWNQAGQSSDFHAVSCTPISASDCLLWPPLPLCPCTQESEQMLVAQPASLLCGLYQLCPLTAHPHF